MKYVYLLLQSEFLRQLCLCFIPSIRNSADRIPIKWIFDFIIELRKKCRALRTNLKTVFDFYYTQDEVNKRESANVNWLHKEAYIKLCSVSLNLQTVLRLSRSAEEFLEDVQMRDADSYEVLRTLETKSEEIRKNYERCKPVIDDFCRYIANLKPKQSPSVVIPVPSSGNNDKKSIPVGVSDFNPHWPDEVFIAMSDGIATETRTTVLEDIDVNPRPQLLLSELKIALQDKAKEWKERERIALQSKNIEEDDFNEEISTCDSEIETSDEKFIPRAPKLIFGSESPFSQQIAAASVSWGIRTEEYFGESEDE